MQITVAGKGGSGKTVIAGTLARVFARRGRRVLAIDGDSNPNLALALGIPREEAGKIRPLPRNLLEKRIDSSGRESSALAQSPEEIVKAYGIKAPDNVTLLLMGQVEHAGVGCMCGAHATTRSLLAELAPVGADATIMDAEAGLEPMSRGTPRHADVMLVVAEPYYKSLETAVRIIALAGELGIPRVYVVANKTRDEADEKVIKEVCENEGLKLIGSVPYDQVVVEAQRTGIAPMDIDDNSPAVGRIAQIAGRLEGRDFLEMKP